MKRGLRPWFPLLVAVLSLPACSYAQTQANQDQAKEPAQTAADSGPKKPIHKLNEVITDDTIALLAVRRAPQPLRAPMGEQPAVAASSASATPGETAQLDAEIAALQKQIADKQLHVELLLKIFVRDERKFLMVPETPVSDPEMRTRLRYEQDELMWETAELAKLKGKLAMLAPPKQ